MNGLGMRPFATQSTPSAIEIIDNYEMSEEDIDLLLSESMHSEDINFNEGSLPLNSDRYDKLESWISDDVSRDNRFSSNLNITFYQ